MGVKYNRPDFREHAISHREKLEARQEMRSRPRRVPPFAMLYAGLFLFASLAIMVSRMTAIELKPPGEMRARAEVLAYTQQHDTSILSLRVFPVDDEPFDGSYSGQSTTGLDLAIGDEIGVSYVYRSATDAYVVRDIFPLADEAQSPPPQVAEPEHPLFEPIPLGAP